MQEENQKIKQALLRIKDVMTITGISRTTIYRLIDKNNFPKPIHPSGSKKISSWVASDVEDWVKEQIANHRDKSR